RRRHPGQVLRRQAREHSRSLRGDRDVLLSRMNGNPQSEGPKLTSAGKLVIAAVVAASLYGAYFFLYEKPARESPRTPAAGPSSPPSEPPPAGRRVEIGIAYGTEKKRWLEAAVAAFAKTPEGASIQVTLIPKGSLEGAQEILRSDDAAKRIQVWSP